MLLVQRSSPQNRHFHTLSGPCVFFRTKPTCRHTACTASARPTVVGIGGAGIDYLASVGTFPEPDSKIRTDKLEKLGGGNCGNACTALARLGTHVRILSAVGDDVLGDNIVTEFEKDGVDTSFLHRDEGADTPFTYIIVDQLGGTRTCIHTPGATLHSSKVTPDLCKNLLRGSDLAYFDGRLTEAALVVALAAKKAGLPVLVEAERLRYNLELLMAEADYVVTSGSFPEMWTGEATNGDAILATALRLPSAKWMVTTFGKAGSLLIERRPTSEVTEGDSVTLDSVISDLFSRLDRMPRGNEQPACSAAGGVAVYPGQVVSTGKPVLLQFDRTSKKEAVALAKALKKSRSIAESQDDEGSLLEQEALEEEESPQEEQQMAAMVYACSAGQVPKESIVDTTGAGDAYIASLMYGLVHGQSIEHMLRLGSVVSACKCTRLGARPGLPRQEDMAGGWL